MSFPATGSKACLVCLFQGVVDSHVSVHQAIGSMDVPPKAAKQHDDQDDDGQGRKSPAQEEVEQVPPLCVLIVHHQHLPEVHCLRKQFRRNTYLQEVPSDV